MNRKRCYHIIVGVMIMVFLTGGVMSYQIKSFDEINLEK